MPDTLPDGRPWPPVSIVTPSYNHGEFLEETIRSLLLQGYPDLDYLIIDGGSADRSVEVIRKYSPWLGYWISEADRGQAHAINKGFARARGAVMNWINSDDLLLPGALQLLGEGHSRHPDDILLADVVHFVQGEERSWLVRQSNVTFQNLVNQWNGQISWHQTGIFAPRTLYTLIGPLDETLRYAFDHDWLFRLTQRAPAIHIGGPVARFRIHGTAKTSAEVPAAMREAILVNQRYWDSVPGMNKRHARAVYFTREAAIFLAQHRVYAQFWNRRAGLRLLLSAWIHYPPLLLSRDFRSLCLRALVPRCLLRSSPWREASP